MSNLNSVLIEGVLQMDAVINNDACIFSILTTRHHWKPGSKKIEEENSVFIVEVLDNKKLVESCTKHAKEGRCARVVGRLKESYGTCECGRERPTFVIVAEHIEYRREPQKASSTRKRQ